MLSLGKRLKYLRSKKKMTQQEVADHLSIQRTTYNYFENDKRIPDVPTLIQLCNLFNSSSDFILGLSNKLSLDNDQNEHDLHFLISNSKNLQFEDVKITDKDKEVIIKTIQNAIDIILMMQTDE